MSASSKFKWLFDKHPPAAWLVLVLSVLVTSWAWYVSDKAVDKTVTERFEFQSQDLVAAISNRMREYEMALRSGRALFDSSTEVTRDDWNAFSDTIYMQKYYPGIQALGYSVMLSPDDLPAHIAAIRAEGFVDYAVKPEGQRQQYSAIKFIEPFDWRNQRAFGYDMYSEPTRREAMDRARDTAQPALSGRVTLVQETNKDVQYGFLMYFPVYHKDLPLEYVEDRRQALKSFVYGAFRMRDLMEGILGQSQGDIGFALYDGHTVNEGAILYRSAPEGPTESAIAPTKFTGEHSINIAGRPWTLHVFTTEGFVPFSERFQPEFIAVVGGMLDVFLFYLISFLARGRRLAQLSAQWANTERDVTQRRLELAADAGNMGLAEWNITEDRLIWDKRMLGLYGYDLNTFTGEFNAWVNRLHPEDRQQAIKAIEHAKRFSNRFDMEFRIVLPDGKTRYIVAYFIIERDQADNPIRMVGFNYDVTPSREAENALTERNWHLQNLLEGTNVGTWKWNVQTGDTEFNERWAEIIGYKLAELQPVSIQTWEQFAHPDDLKGSEQALQRHFMGKTGFYEMESRMRHRDGHWVWVLDRGKVFSWTKDGKPLMMYGTHQDITERKNYESLLKEERDKAELANRSRGEFLANMSHEIRTPINGVIGALNLLSDTHLNASQQNLINISKRSADSLLGLINDILDLSKIESGKLQINEEEVELVSLISDTTLALASRAESKGLTLLCPNHFMQPVNVMVDGLRLRQVITNLINNAIKFTEEGQVTLDVEVLEETSTHISVRFNVRDTGQGITQDKQANLFRRFEQLDNSLTRREGGTGLGLAISKQLIEMMHGRIGVDSVAGVGSTFWFELTLDHADKAQQLDTQKLFKDLAVVAVNASPLYQQYYQSLFDGWHVQYRYAEDIATASTVLKSVRAKHKILVLDASFFTGKKTNNASLDKYRQALSGLSVLVTCPQSMLAVIPQRINEEADLILSKPIVQPELMDALLAVVEDDIEQHTKTQIKEMALNRFEADILVVEDNPTNVAIVTGLLKKFGVRVSLAENGLQALSELETKDFDLVLMDCQMPELDGYETTQRIRHEHRVLNADIPVIALTAHAMREDEQKCLDAGMNDYLTKPIDPFTLNKKLADWLPERCQKKIAS